MPYSISKFISGLLIALVVVGVTSCKKDKESTGIAGKYRVVYLQNGDTLPAYFIFNDDKTYLNLQQTNQYAHKINKGTYQAYGTSVILGSAFSSTTFSLIVKNGDTLKLLGSPDKPDNYDRNYVLVKDAATPGDQEWVDEVSITKQLPAPNVNFSSFTILNSLFYTSYQYYPTIQRFDVADGVQQSTLTTTESYYGVEVVGGNLWGISDGTQLLQKINPTTGAVIFTAAAAPGNMYTLASDGINIYGWNVNANKLYTYNIVGNSYDAGRNFGTDLSDLAYSAGYIYGCAYRYIYKIDPVTLKVVKTYSVKGVKGFSGIAANGASFWVYVSDELNAPGYFAQITLD